MRKYKISVSYIDGTSISQVGIGSPRSTDIEIQIVAPDGKEVVIPKNNVRLFVVSEYTGD